MFDDVRTDNRGVAPSFQVEWHALHVPHKDASVPAACLSGCGLIIFDAVDHRPLLSELPPQGTGCAAYIQHGPRSCAVSKDELVCRLWVGAELNVVMHADPLAGRVVLSAFSIVLGRRGPPSCHRSTGQK